ncbi:hypothetical protein Rsub_02508 [Raphidocelis subcapitata]|uniref:Uncharacterized protein n=1 Tax=Raphidocelis subcapitata TaxID=307507 RepID=A0A2V0NUQ1_9CHLO|nr:hypothetical protein Rsub_02508 [Raphidocelis subcapitata]|eukprot:GBF90402.1 hypothetical protein Rsub_02508 [Raphidocelis subcapitata]
MKKQVSFILKAANKAPKANATMSVKVKFVNQGTAEGAIGGVGLWLLPVAEYPAPFYTGYWNAEGKYNGYVATADFSGVVVKPGKSKTVTIKDVPVPGAPGWWQLSAVVDLNRTLPAAEYSYTWALYAAFEVKAP